MLSAKEQKLLNWCVATGWTRVLNKYTNNAYVLRGFCSPNLDKGTVKISYINAKGKQRTVTITLPYWTIIESTDKELFNKFKRKIANGYPRILKGQNEISNRP